MGKDFRDQLRKQEINQENKILDKLNQINISRRKLFLKDQIKAAAKKNKEFKKVHTNNVYQFLSATSPIVFKSQQKSEVPLAVQQQVHAYKVAMDGVNSVLSKLKNMGIKNQRPSDYLVEMYKSDKQMFKVRRYLSMKQQNLKQKMQGKDWLSKNKRRERAKKKSQAKRQRKKLKMQAKKPNKPKTIKVKGKNKIKK